MTRTLHRIVASDPVAVMRGLEASLTGGHALLPVAEGGPALPTGAPAVVAQAVALVVETSGSTGTGKRVALSADALLAGAAAADASLGGPGRWLLALPTHYIAGINVLTRSIVAGTAPVVLPAGHFDAGAFADAVARMDPSTPDVPHRYTSLVPVQLARILDDPAATAALATFDAVLVGGQATPVALRERAAAAGVRVVTTYGASETSGGCVYDGVPIGTVRTALVDGELLLSGPMLAEGYLGDEDRTAATFVVRDGVRWYRTSDTAEIGADGTVRVLGRLDDVVISGGEKIPLGAVERIVRELPGQHAAVVTRRADPEWGEVPVVVTATPVDPAAVRAAVGERLGRAARPAVLVVDALPMLASGKPDRVAIRALAAG